VRVRAWVRSKLNGSSAGPGGQVCAGSAEGPEGSAAPAGRERAAAAVGFLSGGSFLSPIFYFLIFLLFSLFPHLARGGTGRGRASVCLCYNVPPDKQIVKAPDCKSFTCAVAPRHEMDMQKLGVHEMKGYSIQNERGKDFDLYLSPFSVFLICLLALKCITIHKVPKWYLPLTRAGAESIRLLGETCVSTSPRKAK